MGTALVMEHANALAQMKRTSYLMKEWRLL